MGGTVGAHKCTSGPRLWAAALGAHRRDGTWHRIAADNRQREATERCRSTDGGQVTRRGTNIAEEITSLVSAENRPYIHMLNGLLVPARPPARAHVPRCCVVCAAAASSGAARAAAKAAAVCAYVCAAPSTPVTQPAKFVPMECEMAELLTDMIHLKDRLANIVLDLIQSFASTYPPVHDAIAPLRHDAVRLHAGTMCLLSCGWRRRLLQKSSQTRARTGPLRKFVKPLLPCPTIRVPLGALPDLSRGTDSPFAQSFVAWRRRVGLSVIASLASVHSPSSCWARAAAVALLYYMLQPGALMLQH